MLWRCWASGRRFLGCDILGVGVAAVMRGVVEEVILVGGMIVEMRVGKPSRRAHGWNLRPADGFGRLDLLFGIGRECGRR